jgi:hypothetical protein
MVKMSELDAAELATAYRATTYRVFLPGGHCDLRIDQPCQQLVDWLKDTGYPEFAIITACNPGAQRLAAEVNAERQSALECDLLEGNYEPYNGENRPDASDWPSEESCFIPDIALEDALALAEDYEQNAIVWGGTDGIPRLVWIEDKK